MIDLPSPLPSPLQRRVDSLARALLQPQDSPVFDFSQPRGKAALVTADSPSRRVFKNPLAVFIGGAAAVILKLAEPRVRTGVWEHSSFLADPVRRLQRTGPTIPNSSPGCTRRRASASRRPTAGTSAGSMPRNATGSAARPCRRPGLPDDYLYRR